LSSKYWLELLCSIFDSTNKQRDDSGTKIAMNYCSGQAHSVDADF
jgi:hypothetical protein